MKTKEEIEALFSKLQLVRKDYSDIMGELMAATESIQALGILVTAGTYWSHIGNLETNLRKEMVK